MEGCAADELGVDFVVEVEFPHRGEFPNIRYALEGFDGVGSQAAIGFYEGDLSSRRKPDWGRYPQASSFVKLRRDPPRSCRRGGARGGNIGDGAVPQIDPTDTLGT